MIETKLIILGEGGVGKTTLAMKLLDQNSSMPTEEQTTRGIDIHELQLKLSNNSDFILNIWDFGGQEIYHGTHQLFLTPNSIYIIVDDTRRESDFNYWLQIVDLFGQGSPLIIVQNEKQERKREIDFESIQHRFEFVTDVVSTNLLTNRGLDDVWTAIKSKLANLPTIDSQLPDKWFDVREKLKKLKHEKGNEVLPIDKYFQICAQSGIDKIETAIALSEYFNDSGLFLHFKQNKNLSNNIFLNVYWLIKAIYMILDSEIPLKSKGFIFEKDFSTIWSKTSYKDYFGELLEIMQQFEFCFKLPDKKAESWVIPQLLPIAPPNNFSWENSNNLQIKYRYEFLPIRFFYSLIVRLHRFISMGNSAIWREGCTIETYGAKAYISISNYYSKEINVRVIGERNNYFLAIIDNEISTINESYERIKVETLIPCNCTECTRLEIPYFYRKGNLFKRLHKNRTIVECEISFEDVSVQGLIESVFGSIDIAQQDSSARLRYVEEGEKQGEQPLREAKIVVVGAGGAGKTTLIQKLKNPTHPVPNSNDKRTQGIKVSQFELRKSIDGKTVKAYIWDFGGQELYYSTHQFFLSRETFYILLNDNRKNDTDFYYWLNVLAIRAGEECPVLCVFNEKENAKRQISLEDHQFSFFPGIIVEPEDIDFASPKASLFENLRETIEQHFIKMPILKKRFPSYWIEIRNALEQVKVPYITWRQFHTICIEQNVPEADEEQMRIIAQTLHNLGSILWFPQVFGMDHLLILNPQWCLDATYKILDSEKVQKAKGKFERSDLIKMWSSDSYSEQKASLEQLLRHFDLCYEITPNSGQFIAPQLLDIKANPYNGFPKAGCIIFKHKYDFMPSGLISRFIARMAQYICRDQVWRKGVTLDWGNDTIGEAIEDTSRREITLKVSGKDRKRRMNEMRNILETIQSPFRGLSYEQLVSCNCPDCSKSSKPTIHNLEYLEDHAKDSKEVLCKSGTRKWIPAQHILEGFEFTDEPRIFISYSHKNEEHKNAFREMIFPLAQNRNWKVWDDRYILPGEEWNISILRQLSEANIIVLLLTSSFFNSEFIYNIELTRAIERHEAGSALLIGVIVSACLWEETPLRRIQMLPVDGKPVDQHQNASEVWKQVADKIKYAVSKREQVIKFTS